VRTTLAAVVLVAVLLAILWTQQRRLIYFPFGPVPHPREIGLAGTTEVAFQTSDGLTLHGWFVSRTAEPSFTVIVFNGNAGNRAMRASLGDALVRRGMAVLLFDYRGFGGNPGTPTEAGLRLDARAAREYIASRPAAERRRIVYFGESLGTGVAAALAADNPPTALILRSPFVSMVEVGQHHYGFVPVQWLLRDRYATGDLIGRVRVPLLIIAGDQDRIVPIAQSRRLFERANQPKSMVVISNADHNDDSLFDGAEMIEAITRFLEKLL
jgi:uncharacterized protein